MALPNEMTFKSSNSDVEKNSPAAVIQSVPQVAPKAVALPEVTKPAPVKAAVAAAPAPVAKAAAAAPASNQAVQVSQDKVKEMAAKLGVPMTKDLLGLGSNEAISSALIDKAVAAGKSEEQINAAMSVL
jgi:hypothetical protein